MAVLFSLLVVLLVVLFIYAVLYVRHISLNTRKSEREPPVISGPIPYFGVAFSFAQDPRKYLEKIRRTYGDVFTLVINGQRMSFLLDHRHLAVINAHSSVFKFKPFSDQISVRVFDIPTEALAENHDRLLHQFYNTNLLNSKSTKELLERSLNSFRAYLLSDRKKAGQESSDSIYNFIWTMMFEVHLDTLMSQGKENKQSSARQTHSEEKVNKLRDELQAFDSDFSLLVAGVPSFLVKKALKARTELVEHLLTPLPPTACELFVVRQKYLTENGFSNSQQATLVLSLLWAALGNTVPTSFWVISHLLLNEKALTAVKNELRQVIGFLPSGVSSLLSVFPTLTVEKMSQLRILESCIRESLRLCAASMIVRLVQEDVVVKFPTGSQGDNSAQYQFRKGDLVCFYPSVVHLDAAYFPEPETYQYDRFLSKSDTQVKADGEVNDDSSKTSSSNNNSPNLEYLRPFGAGISMCPGRNFALQQMKLLAIVMICAFDIQLLKHQLPPMDQKRAGLGILAPLYDLPFKYKILE